MSSTSRADTVTTTTGETYDAYVAIPESGRGPGVLLLQEIFGVNEFLKGKARDLADLGYVVLCPDVFWRVERNVSLPHDETALKQAFSYAERFFAQDPAQISSDLLAALDRLRQLPEVEGKVAAMGYCLGGRLAYEVAVAGDPDGCVSYYGSGIADRVEVAGEVKCPVIFHFGGSDPFIPTDQVERIRGAMGDRPDVELHVQDDAGHAFENSLAPQFHHADAAARSWPLTVAFLERELRS
jgi:carboxymethylenebutenolidase